MKRLTLLLAILSLSLCGCANQSSSSSSLSSTSSSSDSSSVSSSSSLTGQAYFESQLKGEHKFPSYSLNTTIISSQETLYYEHLKKEIDLTSYIERTSGYRKELTSLDGSNTGSKTTSFDIYKTVNETYTCLETGLYQKSNSSDAIFSLYQLNNNFSGLTYSMDQSGYDYSLSSSVSDPNTFMASTAFSKAQDMHVVAIMSSDAVLNELTITYKSDNYDVKLAYSFTYLSVTLALPV